MPPLLTPLAAVVSEDEEDAGGRRAVLLFYCVGRICIVIVITILIGHRWGGSGRRRLRLRYRSLHRRLFYLGRAGGEGLASQGPSGGCGGADAVACVSARREQTCGARCDDDGGGGVGGENEEDREKYQNPHEELCRPTHPQLAEEGQRSVGSGRRCCRGGTRRV